MQRVKWALLGGAVIVALALVGAIAAGPFTRTPSQPIPFPHDVHAGTNQIPCMYCHYSADRSVSAGIPPVSMCAGCHFPGGVPIVAADSPGVQLLADYWNRREPIPWVRIYKVHDHVRFPHMIHVNAGLECQECHGPVEEMAEIRRVVSLRMGWCINCHVEREARIDCFVCHY